jgi:ATP-binding cassette subfamily B protein
MMAGGIGGGGMGLGIGIGHGHAAHGASSSEEQAGRVRDWQLLCRLLMLLRRHAARVLCSVACATADIVLQVLGPLVISLAIDNYFAVRERSHSLSASWLPADPIRGLALLSSAYLAILLSAGAVQTLQAYLAVWTGQQAMAELRERLFGHLQRLDITFYDSNPAGRLVTRVTNDVEALSELFSNGIVGLMANFVMVVFFLLAMFKLSPRLTLVLAAVLPAFVALTWFFRQKMTPAQQRVRILVARINAMIAEHISGIAVLHLFNRQTASQKEFDGINREHMVASKGWVTANSWFMPSVELMGTISQAGLLWTGAALLGNTGGKLTLGVLVAFLQYGAKFLRPIQDLSERYGIIQTSIVSAERVFRLLDTPASAPAPIAVPVPDGAEIEFDHVWFAYRGEEWVLRDVSFRVSAGRSLAVVGHTGAGKTTLTNLLLRFYSPQRGAIRLDGIDIAEMDLPALRRKFGVVLQDTYLHEGSVLENIRFGCEPHGAERARSAARHVQLDALLTSLPQGLDTQVEERGDNLSSGQKQLIGIARAICRDPEVLILDEATSDVDVETERHVQRALATLLDGRTSIVIAHRLSTVLRADCIMVLHKGSVRESGTHSELLARRGLYWRLCRLQFGQQQRDRDTAPWAEAPAPEPVS